MRDYQKTIEFNPARLEEIEDRLAEINGLKRKYGNDIATILEYRETIGSELEALSMGEESMDALKAEIQTQQKELAGLAVELAKKREQAAEKLKKDVEKELRDLSMKHVQFGVRFLYEPDAEGFTTYKNKKTRTHANGIGEIEFLFSPNPGEELRPLAKIASGGEISRVMLALKSILNDQDPVPVMVFDEVDSGISGGVAEKVGIKLKKISAKNRFSPSPTCRKSQAWRIRTTGFTKRFPGNAPAPPSSNWITSTAWKRSPACPVVKPSPKPPASTHGK